MRIRAQATAGVAAAILITACGSVRASGGRGFQHLDRAEMIRCSFEGAPVTGVAGISDLAGDWTLQLTSEDGAQRVIGILSLRAPGGTPVGGTGSRAVLIGDSDIDPSSLGAMVPGEIGSTETGAPGVGAYVFPATSSTATDERGDPTLMAVLRLGSESNRTDRQRFDGAHTTLNITSIAEDRFGGTWSSAEGSATASGGFCAVRP